MTPTILDGLVLLALFSVINASLWIEVVSPCRRDSARGRLVENILAKMSNHHPMISNYLHRNVIAIVLGWTLLTTGLGISEVVATGPHLPAAGAAVWASRAFVVVGLVVWILFVPGISAFNRPRFLVPPHWRDQPGWVVARLAGRPPVLPEEREGAEDPSTEWGPISARVKWVGCGAAGGLLTFSVFRLITDDEWIFIAPLTDVVVATVACAVLAGAVQAVFIRTA